MEPIHFFRAGRHTSSDGKAINFSEGDLAAIAEVYQPAIHEAPIVVGHPKTEAPAYGWVERLEARPNGLYAIPRQVNPEFADIVRQGAYKKVSGSFFLPDSKSNPTPGKFYLRHIGFLGAVPPALKGLTPVSFSEEDPGLVDFSEDTFDLREYTIRVRERDFRRRELQHELDVLAKEAKIRFCEVEPLLSFMEGLTDDRIVNFSDFEKRPVFQPQTQYFLDFLKSRIPFVTLGELAGSEDPTEDPEFCAPQGYTTDEDQMDLHARAIRYQMKHNCSYWLAVREIAKKDGKL